MKTMAKVALGVSVGALAACGDSPKRPVDTAALYRCLYKIPDATASDAVDSLDVISQNAGLKGISLNFASGQELQIAVERGDADAKNTLKAYGLFFEETGPRQLERDGSVVLAYTKTPTAEETGPVDKCMKG